MSFHEKWFERRWYGFRPRTRKVAAVAALVLVGSFLLWSGAILLWGAGHRGWAVAAGAPVVLVFIIYNTLGLHRSDW